MSVNVRAANHSPEKICELNNKDANSHPEDLMLIHQSSFHGTKVMGFFLMFVSFSSKNEIT